MLEAMFVDAPIEKRINQPATQDQERRVSTFGETRVRGGVKKQARLERVLAHVADVVGHGPEVESRVSRLALAEPMTAFPYSCWARTAAWSFTIIVALAFHSMLWPLQRSS